MSSDNVTRSGPAWAVSSPGPGLNMRFLCARCNKPCQQQGSKLRRFQGLRRRVCAPCHAILAGPKVST